MILFILKQSNPFRSNRYSWRYIQVETDINMKFGDPTAPLLLAVRSGAAVSMPGMMDTVLNLGLNDEVQ